MSLTIDYFNENLYLNTALVCFLLGLIPGIAIEFYLIAVAMIITSEQIVLVSLVATSTSVLAKVLIYYLCLKAMSLLPKAQQQKLETLRHRYKTKDDITTAFLIFSATVGLPPYYLCNILCGILRVNILVFTFASFIGSLLRFGAILLVPQFFLSLHAYISGNLHQ